MPANGVHAVMDLRHLFNTDTTNSESEEATKMPHAAMLEDEEDAKIAKKLALKDWEQELKRRIARNAKKDQAHRKPVGEVKNKFWSAYFKANWKPEVAKKLYQIDLLKTDIEDIGFDPLLNPLLAFFLREYTQKLVLADLINAENFKALNNAVAEGYVADSEFLKENDYNILYCQDLYKQTSRDIEDYLKLQKSILKPDAQAYGAKTRNVNIKVFLENGSKSMLDPGAKLNSLEDVKDYIEKITGGRPSSRSGGSEDKADGNKKDTSRESLVALVHKLSGQVELLAALQFVSMSTDSEDAKKVLKNIKVDAPAADLISATAEVSKYLRGMRFDDSTTKSFVELLSDALRK